MFEIKIKGLDELCMALRQHPLTIMRAKKSALSTVGMTFRKIARDEGYRGRQLLDWPARSPYTGTLAKAKSGRNGNRNFMVARQRYKRTRRNYYEREGKRMTRRWLSTALNPYGKLINAIRYKTEQGVLKMGFLEDIRPARTMAEKAAQGFTITTISPRTRRFFFALHLPLTAGKNAMTVPARPYIGKVWARHEAQMFALFRKKFYLNLERYRSGRSKV